MNGKLLPRGKMPEITCDYNHNFASVQGLQVSYGVAVKRFQAINKLFNRKWHPQQMKEAYLSVFSIDTWKTLSQEEREKHTLKECKVCNEKFAILNNAFPAHVKRGKKPIAVPKKVVQIEFTGQDMSTPKALGRKVLRELDNLSQERFQKSGEDVLIDAPKSHLVRKPTPEDLRKSKRNIEKKIKESITKEKEQQACDIVLQNRMSWSTYDKLRKAEGLTETPKRQAPSCAEGEPRKKKRYGDLANTLDIEKEKLLEEAEAW